MDFRGASAETVAVLTDRLKTAVATSPQAASAAAGSLFSVSQTLRAEPALRRFATDGAIPGEAKAALVADVFGGKVDAAALEVLTAAVARRWTHAGDLPDGIERLSEVAAVLSAGDRGGQLSDELFTVRAAVQGSPELREALSDPARSTADKAALLEDLLGDKVQPATLALAKQSLAGSYGTAASALSAYRRLAADVHGEGVATVHTAVPLTEEQTTRLTAALARQYGRPIHANVVVDALVIGGLRIEIGDDVIDGTIATRLDDVTRRLAG